MYVLSIYDNICYLIYYDYYGLYSIQLFLINFYGLECDHHNNGETRFKLI